MVLLMVSAISWNDVKAFDGFGGGLGMGGGISGFPGGGLMQVPTDQYGMKIVPMISASETYDSNVYRAPKATGLGREDFISTISPGLTLQRNTEAYTVMVNGGLNASYFVNNPRLGYVGSNATVSLGLTPIIARYSPGSSLSMSYGYFYSPYPPAFLTGGAGRGVTPASGTTDPSSIADASYVDIYARGLQLGRVNTTGHTAALMGGYQVVPGLVLATSYAYSTRSFGGFPSQLQGTSAFLSASRNVTTSTHQISFGPRYEITPADTVNLTYAYMDTAYESRTVDLGSQSFTTQTLTAGWGRKLGPNWVLNFGGGGSLVRRQFSSSVQDLVTYTGSASLNWSGVMSTVGVGYSVGVYPSIIGSGGPLWSHNASVFGRHRFTDRISGLLGVAFADFSSVGGRGQEKQSFRSYTANASVSYMVAPSFYTTLGGTYGLFEGTGFFNLAGSQETRFTRETVTLSMVKYFQ